MTYDDFFQVYGDHGHWKRRQAEKREYFESDLRRALAGCPEGFHEIAIYGAAFSDKVLIIRDLWRVGVPIPCHEFIQQEWCLESRRFVDAFGCDLDGFFSDVGFGLGRLPPEFDVWRGSNKDETIEELAAARSWTTSYSVACAFALQNNPLWQNARMERMARDTDAPEPTVVTRHVRRDQVIAWIGGLEREVILGQAALGLPIHPCGSLRDWRRRRCRKRVSAHTR